MKELQQFLISNLGHELYFTKITYLPNTAAAATNQIDKINIRYYYLRGIDTM